MKNPQADPLKKFVLIVRVFLPQYRRGNILCGQNISTAEGATASMRRGVIEYLIYNLTFPTGRKLLGAAGGVMGGWGEGDIWI
jgi:hypothetical protein